MKKYKTYHLFNLHTVSIVADIPFWHKFHRSSAFCSQLFFDVELKIHKLFFYSNKKASNDLFDLQNFGLESLKYFQS